MVYTKDDIIKMEMSLLSLPGFRIGRPTWFHFLEQFHFATEAYRDLALYLLMNTLVHTFLPAFGQYRSSYLAAAAVLVSNKMVGRQPCWPLANVNTTKLTEQSLKQCAMKIRALHEYAEQSPWQAVRKKFSHLKVLRLDTPDAALTAYPDLVGGDRGGAGFTDGGFGHAGALGAEADAKAGAVDGAEGGGGDDIGMLRTKTAGRNVLSLEERATLAKLLPGTMSDAAVVRAFMDKHGDSLRRADNVIRAWQTLHRKRRCQCNQGTEHGPKKHRAA